MIGCKLSYRGAGIGCNNRIGCKNLFRVAQPVIWVPRPVTGGANTEKSAIGEAERMRDGRHKILHPITRGAERPK